MTTIDDILSPLKPKDEPLKGFYQADNTNGGASSVPVNAGEVAGRVGVVPDDIADHDPNKGMEDANAVAKQKQHMSFAEMMEQLMPKPKTKEELAAEQNKRKRDAVFAAIGDGLNAFHQAYAYSRGIKPLTENKSMTKELRDRLERLDKEDEAKKLQYLNYYMRAMQMNDERERNERNWNRTLERDKAADEKEKRDFEFRKEQAERQQQNWQKNFDRQSEQWQKEFENRVKQQGLQNDLHWANHNLAVQSQKDSKDLKEKQISASAAKAVRGKQIGFSDGKGNNVSIYENVWKGSMEQVYDAIINDFEEMRKANPKENYPRAKKNSTASQKDDFVKQHWHKSPTAIKLMQTLSGIDPAKMTSSTDSGGGLGWEKVQDDNEQTDW